jgi:iron complex transport system permease protein
LQRTETIKFSVLVLLLLAGLYFSLFFGGSSPIALSDLDRNNFIFWEIRFPKTLTALLAGSTLAISGLILQILFRNPLAGPYVLGISSGAALMVAMGILAGSSFNFLDNHLAGRAYITLLSISGSVLITLLILAVSRKVQSNVVLLLIGLMFSQICGAIQSSIEYFAEPAALKVFVIWGMGSLSATTTDDLKMYALFALLLIAVSIMFIKALNALLLGEYYAENLGISYKRNRFLLLLISSMLTGLTTAFCGPIAFAGVAVPILSRMVFGTSRQQVHIFSCFLIGAIVLLFADAICNSIPGSSALPINMVTTIIGAPVVIYLMFKNKKW